MRLFRDHYNDELSPLIKWAGGKEQEIKYIVPNSPDEFTNYYEPFVGGGSVYTSFRAKHAFINDKSSELMGLYERIARQDGEFFRLMEQMVTSWELMLAFVAGHRELVEHYLAFRREAISEAGMQRLLLAHIASHQKELEAVVPEELVWHRDVFREELNVNVVRKIMRMRKIERSKREMPVEDVFDNVETAFMSALYMYYRALYNDVSLASACPSLGTALFVFIRNYAYSGMFRYNRSGEFNVPYGGIAYNHKSLRKKLDYYRQESLLCHFANTTLCNLDFEEFFQRYTPGADDFVFLDPPYDSEFSTYARNEFTQRDQERLATYLLNGCAARWMLVIKNTDFIHGLYANHGLTIRSFSKTYLVSFMNRNDRSAEHLMITNY